MSNLTSDLTAEADAYAADPTAWGNPIGTLTGADAAQHGRAALEAAGVDADAVERAAVERAAGRPRLDGHAGTKGQRSPRINVSITPSQDAAIRRIEATGQSRSEIVRSAVEEYLAARAYGHQAIK